MSASNLIPFPSNRREPPAARLSRPEGVVNFPAYAKERRGWLWAFLQRVRQFSSLRW